VLTSYAGGGSADGKGNRISTTSFYGQLFGDGALFRGEGVLRKKNFILGSVRVREGSRGSKVGELL